MEIDVDPPVQLQALCTIDALCRDAPVIIADAEGFSPSDRRQEIRCQPLLVGPSRTLIVPKIGHLFHRGSHLPSRTTPIARPVLLLMNVTVGLPNSRPT